MKNIFIILFASFVLFSCGNHNSANENVDQSKPSLASLKSKEDSLQALISNATTVNNELGKQLINVYAEIIKQYPNDEQTPSTLFKAGEVSEAIGMHELAISYYADLFNRYPDHVKAPMALFLQAFIYENQLNQLGKAKQLYEKLVDKYPNAKIAADAKMCIQHLGKSEEELIKEFEAKNKAK